MDFPQGYKCWYAIRVRSRCEKLAAADLTAKGFVVCAATAPRRRVWVDRIRTIEMPLFPGYIFARFHRSERRGILGGAGVAEILGAAGMDYAVADEEMEAILKLLRSGAEVFHAPFMHVGARVRVGRGPLAGVIGTLVQIKSHYRLVLSVDCLQRSVSVEIDSALVEPMPVRDRSRPMESRVAV